MVVCDPPPWLHSSVPSPPGTPRGQEQAWLPVDNGPPNNPSPIFRAAFTRRSKRVSLTTGQANLEPASILSRPNPLIPSRHPPIERTNFGLSAQACCRISPNNCAPKGCLRVAGFFTSSSPSNPGPRELPRPESQSVWPCHHGSIVCEEHPSSRGDSTRAP